MLITKVLHVMSCCCYHKGTYFQANHNNYESSNCSRYVVVATTKVRIFKQITTIWQSIILLLALLLLPQRYVFSSKSQRLVMYCMCTCCCCCYHKGTYFQANHNIRLFIFAYSLVVVATTKVRIFKQITTRLQSLCSFPRLLLLPQRYVFSSKSQHILTIRCIMFSCCCYHKGTYFQANHNKC